MNNYPEIHLKLNAKFVRTCEVPALIANALYSDANYLELPVIDLYKIRKQNTEQIKPALFNFLSRKNTTSKPVDNWYEPLSQLDEDILRNDIWLHLPELKFPISVTDWHKYGEAFANWESEINFELKPDRVEWAYEPAGDEKSFYKLNRDTRNKLGMFEEDFVSDENIAIQESGIAEFNHIGLLRKAIQRGEIEQLDPNSNIPTTTYLPYGKITFADLKVYVQKFKITLIDDESDCKDNAPPHDNETQDTSFLHPIYRHQPRTNEFCQEYQIQPTETKNENEPEQRHTPEQTQPANNEIAAATVSHTNSIQKNKLRINTLDPAIDKAIKSAGGFVELAHVYLKLKELALAEERPFTGVLDGDALCYTDDNGQPAKLSKDALGKRLKRR